LARTGVIDLRAQPRLNALDLRFKVIFRGMNYPSHSLQVDQRKYGEDILLVKVPCSKLTDIFQFATEIDPLQTNRPKIVGLPMPGNEVAYSKFFGFAFTEHNNFAHVFAQCLYGRPPNSPASHRSDRLNSLSHFSSSRLSSRLRCVSPFSFSVTITCSGSSFATIWGECVATIS